MVVYKRQEERVVQQSWHLEPCIVGVDEAGRGPVLGPMVYAVAISPVSNAAALKGREFADSKILAADKRDELFLEIENDELLCCFVDEISPAEISGKMLAPEKISLNVIAFESTCSLLRKCLESNINVQEVYVDTVGDSNSYQRKLSESFPGIKFTVKPKADALYPIVSAASIAAKVSRDRVIDILGKEKGSGYPADPKTKEWLASSIDPVFGFDTCVRFSWGTADKLLEKKALKIDWECEEDDAVAKLSFMPTAIKKGDNSSHSYLSSRRMQRYSIQ